MLCSVFLGFLFRLICGVVLFSIDISEVFCSGMLWVVMIICVLCDSGSSSLLVRGWFICSVLLRLLMIIVSGWFDSWCWCVLLSMLKLFMVGFMLSCCVSVLVVLLIVVLCVWSCVWMLVLLGLSEVGIFLDCSRCVCLVGVDRLVRWFIRVDLL